MKINKYLLSALAVVAATVVAISCSDDDDNNNSTPTTDTTDVVSFGTAPSFSEEFVELSGSSVSLITEPTVRYHVANILGGIFTVTMIETATDVILIDVGPDDRFVSFDGLRESGGELRAYANAIGKPLSILMTHDHFDHWGGMDDFTDVQVYAHSDVAPLLSLIHI